MNMTYFLISFLSMAAIALVALIIAMRESERADRESRHSRNLARVNKELRDEVIMLTLEKNLRVATEYNKDDKRRK